VDFHEVVSMSTTPTIENATLEDRLYTVKYEDPGDSHLDVKIPGICEDKCRERACVTACPADVWREGDDGVPRIAYENCLECGTCRFACPNDNVVWTYPEHGSGVTYKKG
jgi:ferredoxin like protein